MSYSISTTIESSNDYIKDTYAQLLRILTLYKKHPNVQKRTKGKF